MPALASAAAAALVAAGLLTSAPPSPQVVLTIEDPALDESSGLAASALHDGVLWTHNDGGTSAQVVALDRSGRSVATVTLAGIDPYDPEALAPGVDDASRPALYLGDIGDNLRERPDVSVFRFTEPTSLRNQTVSAQWYRFRYPDGPHDAEALLVSPTGRIFIATKGLGDGALYRAPQRLVSSDRGVNRLTRLADVPILVTDGAFLPDGRFVLRTYSAVYLYDRPGHQVAWAPLPSQQQGESVAVARPDADRLLVGSEGVHSQVLAVPVPVAGRGSSTASPSDSPSARAPSGGQTPGPDGPARAENAWRWAVPSAAVLLLGALLFAVRRGRRPR